MNGMQASCLLRPRRRAGIVAISLIGLLTVRTAAAQTSGQPPATFTFESAVSYALAHYPAVQAALARQMAADAGVGLARTNYLPRADMLWQGNRATHNNFFGLLFPQNIVPPISGPVLPTTSNSSAWDSAAGILVSWEPFDFGYRPAVVNAARANQATAIAGTALTRLQVAAAAASAFFNLLSAQQLVQAAQADADRRQILSNSIHVLVDNQLRPGADSSRADAELAAARIRLIQAQTAERVAQSAFADLMGVPTATVAIDAGPLLQLPPENAIAAGAISNHPTALVENAQAQADSAQIHILDRSYYPHFYVQSSVSGRGTGVNTDGTLKGGANGLGLDRANWAAGLTVSFQALDLFSIRARKQVATAQLKAQQAVYSQTIQDLTSQAEQARATAEGARSIAQNTPVELQAARDTEMQARARYQSGLASIVEISDAQSLLAQAEISDAVAKLTAWSSLVSLAVAQGDLQPLLQLSQAGGGR